MLVTKDVIAQGICMYNELHRIHTDMAHWGRWKQLSK